MKISDLNNLASLDFSGRSCMEMRLERGVLLPVATKCLLQQSLLSLFPQHILTSFDAVVPEINGLGL